MCSSWKSYLNENIVKMVFRKMVIFTSEDICGVIKGLEIKGLLNELDVQNCHTLATNSAE